MDDEFEKKTVSEMSPSEVHYLKEYLSEVNSAFTNTANSMYTSANDTEQSLSSQLMLLNTVILTASLLAIGNGDLFSLLTPVHKFLICAVFILQIISIYSGIAHYHSRFRFFGDGGDNAKVSADLAKIGSFTNLEDMKVKIKSNEEKARHMSGELELRVQVGSIALSLIIFFVLIIAIFYNIPYYEN